MIELYIATVLVLYVIYECSFIIGNSFTYLRDLRGN